MASKLDICNLALIFLHKKMIQDLDGSTPEASTLRRLYPVTYDYLLREHPWSFSTKMLALALAGETNPLYSYVYQYPLDCVKAVQLVSPEDIHTPQDYEIALGDNGTKVILTDIEYAVLRYTVKDTDQNNIDSSFVVVFASRLAADAAINLTGKIELWEAAEKRYYNALIKAKAADASEIRRTATPESEIYRSRL